MRLDGKVTLITGVSQYMGPAFTKTFTDAGAVVCTQDRTRTDAEPMPNMPGRTPAAA
jgi:NAD(P)-dependent dehydrogenase (short-subunit alcohol dehydrogenase family)